MKRRTQWSERLDPESVPTPVHARSTWPSSLRGGGSREEKEEKVLPVNVATPTSSRLNRVLLWALLSSMCFMCILIFMAYQHEHFIPIVATGSLGVFVLSAFILYDRLPVTD